MSDHMKKVKSGDRLSIPAETFNTFIDAARDHRTRQQNRGQAARPSNRSTGTILVKNASGADRDRFDVLGVDAPIFTPTDNEDSFKNQVALKGVTPSEDNHEGRFVILQEPVRTGDIGRAVVAGVTPVVVNVSDTEHGFADIADGVAGKLVSAESGGAQILWAELGTGDKWAVVRLSPPGTDEKVKVDSEDDAAYLEDQVTGDDTWISVAKDNGKMKMSHTGPGPTYYSGICPDDFELDQWGHVRRIYDLSIPGWVGPCA